ncbi:MAG: class I SAM-dependent methyltransferase [Chitinophagaceae bacterium]
MNSVHYTSCPVCDSKEINPLLTVPDHSVSKESFVVWQCSQCTLRFTQDAPDEAHIEKYYRSEDYISHTNTDKGIINKLYQRARTFTLEQKKNLIKKTTGLERGALLDVGAGTGAFVASMKESGWEATGIEPDADARNLAKKTFNADLLDISQLQHLSPASFNAITLWHVLEHVHQLHYYIERLKDLLHQNGKLFIAVPNYTSGDASIYNLWWAAYDVPRHLYHFNPRSMEVLMNRHGLKINEQRPMWLDAFYISLLSSKYRNKKPKLLAAGFNGLRSNIKAAFNKERCSSIIYIIEKA